MSYLDKSALKIVGSRPIRPDGVDKVTGRANFGADMVMPGMLWGRIKRSPHAHARIVSINTAKAAALPGVKAVITRADFPDLTPAQVAANNGPHNLRDLSENCMAKGKALYEGHAVAAVAATSPLIADQALDLIEVQYEILPHVMDVEAAMADGAPLLHDNIFTAGVEPKPTKPSNITKVVRFTKGDVEAGFKEADIVVERRYTTQPVHQGYIEPHACLVSVGADGQTTIFSSSQGQFMVRAYTARICGAEIADIRAIPAEIGGGFGGKTIIYLEPLAFMLSKKSGRPVKIVMSREEVFRATGPTSGAVVEVKLGAKKDGHITAAQTVLKYQSGAFPGSPVQQGCICSLAVYDLPNAETTGYDVLCNRPKVAAYRAPGAPIGSFAVESCIDELAHLLKIDPLKLREINGAKDGTKAAHGPTFNNIGYQKTLEAARAGAHLKTPLGPNQGRGIASGYWHNAGGESSAACHINEDGSVTVTEGHPDIGGSRASMAMMVAEVLGVPFENVRPVVGDTTAIGFSASTGGSRVTFAGGMAVTQAAEKVIEELKKRAA
ncbi:MAG TPA: xanthine dehydrogenase family protein molybdopterin-binding subunit, partial [Stellaceae bacterium]|nr:xanthine dehydrogenase family protein molybdopterin-binding subunit [Stellaceae bacterium]